MRADRDDLETLSFINHGHEGYTTVDLLEGKKIEAVIKDDPELIIFENSLINNHYQTLNLEQTEMIWKASWQSYKRSCRMPKF